MRSIANTDTDQRHFACDGHEGVEVAVALTSATSVSTPNSGKRFFNSRTTRGISPLGLAASRHQGICPFPRLAGEKVEMGAAAFPAETPSPHPTPQAKEGATTELRLLKFLRSDVTN
jgi:hypothetical protein